MQGFCIRGEVEDAKEVEEEEEKNESSVVPPGTNSLISLVGLPTATFEKLFPH